MLHILIYTYNGFGQRVKKEVDGVVTLFHYDFEGKLIAEGLPNGTITTEYLYMGSSPLAMVDVNTNVIYYYVNNHLGTPVMITNDIGKMVWEAVYDPFGQADVSGNSTVVNNLRFSGQYYDEETGLHYNYHRYYDPRTGRYLTPDKIRIETFNIPIFLRQFLKAENSNLFNETLLKVGSHLRWYYMDDILSVYQYVSNNPVNHYDWSGEFKGKPTDIIRFFSCVKGLIENAKNIENFREECRQECDPEIGTEKSMYKCAVRKTWDNFEKCLKLSLPGG